MDQVERVAKCVSELPDGPLRRHFQRAVDDACDTLRSGAPASPLALAPTPGSAQFADPCTDLVTLTLARLSAAGACPALKPSTLGSSIAALAILCHAALLEHAASLHCTGAHDTPPGSSFAAAHRVVPASVFLPPGLDADAQADSYWFRYKRHSAGRLGDTTLFLHCSASRCGTVMHIAAKTDRSAHGGGGLEASLDLPLERYVAASSNAAAPAAAGLPTNAVLAALVAARCAPLSAPALSARLQGDIDCQLLCPLLGADIIGAPAAPKQQQQQQQHHHHHHPGVFGGVGGPHSLPAAAGAHGGGFMGMCPPLTGRVPGHFDGDLWPNPNPAEPGGAFFGGGQHGGGVPPFGGAQGGGSLVGPGHPMFGMVGEYPPLGGLPPGVPPGARFDPIGPLGVGGGVGRGGVPGRGALGPGPDHLRPPPFNSEF